MIFPDTLHKYHRNRLITLENTAISNRLIFFRPHSIRQQELTQSSDCRLAGLGSFLAARRLSTVCRVILAWRVVVATMVKKYYSKLKANLTWPNVAKWSCFDRWKWWIAFLGLKKRPTRKCDFFKVWDNDTPIQPGEKEGQTDVSSALKRFYDHYRGYWENSKFW